MILFRQRYPRWWLPSTVEEQDVHLLSSTVPMPSVT